MKFISNVSRLSRHSYAKVKIQCEFATADNCFGEVEQEYQSVMNISEKNDGKYICLNCFRFMKQNHEYNYDINLLKIIDTTEKAYLLGWIASNINVSKTDYSITIAIDKSDLICLKNLRNIICKDIAITSKIGTDLMKFEICSQQIYEDAFKHLQIKYNNKNYTIKFPQLNSDELSWIFLRGLFDGDGYIDYKQGIPECGINSNLSCMLQDIAKFVKIPCNIDNNNINYYGTNCIDFLGKLYDNSNEYRLQQKYEQYMNLITLGYREITNSSLNECYIYKTDKNAVIPSKSKASDIGYDITIIKKEKELLNNIVLYDTGIKVRVKHGFYAEVVPRSSLSKSGYMLVNSIGIIDPSYTGNIFIALIKILPDAQEIKFPFKCCQLIFRQQFHLNIIEVVEDFGETSRGEGGFGSTDIKKLCPISFSK